MGDCRNQIDVAMDIEKILKESGLKYQMLFQDKTQDYIFVLKNKEDKENA